MRKLVVPLFTSLAVLHAAAALADAQELTVVHSIAIAAPPDAVWAVAGDFAGLPKWYPPIEASRVVLGRNNEVNCIRELTRRNGTKVTERLLDYDSHKRRLEYTYVDGMVMSSDYFAVLEVKDSGDGSSLVEWKARFKRLAYWTDDPPPGQDDKTVLEALNAGYKLGLENLKKIVEGRGR
jgi:mxaD protein